MPGSTVAALQGCLGPEYTLHACAALSLAWVIGLTTYFANSLSGWYALTFEGTFEIMMTCLLVFAVLTPIANTCDLACLSTPVRPSGISWSTTLVGKNHFWDFQYHSSLGQLPTIDISLGSPGQCVCPGWPLWTYFTSAGLLGGASIPCYAWLWQSYTQTHMASRVLLHACQ